MPLTTEKMKEYNKRRYQENSEYYKRASRKRNMYMTALKEMGALVYAMDIDGIEHEEETEGKRRYRENIDYYKRMAHRQNIYRSALKEGVRLLDAIEHEMHICDSCKRLIPIRD